MGAIVERFGNRPYWTQYLFDGRAYTAKARFEVPKNGGTAAILFRVGEDVDGYKRLSHFLTRDIITDSGGYFDIEVFEDVTVTDVGDPIDSFSNLNRVPGIQKDSAIELYKDPTYTGGLRYDYDFIPTGGGNRSTGIFASGLVQRVLKPNTDYIMLITNQGTVAPSIVHVNLVWYESIE